MDRPIAIAIETSSRHGGVALGAADQLVETAEFQSDRRQSVQLVARLENLLRRHGLRARDLDEVYVSVGPGSFTGLRVGITVARTLCQAAEIKAAQARHNSTRSAIRCVAVPTAEAVAQNAIGLDFRDLGVVMDAKENTIYAATFRQESGRIVPGGFAGLIPADRLSGQVPRPILLIGEALWYQTISDTGFIIGEEALWLPSAKGVWRVGRRLAKEGNFADPRRLRPMYLRQPEAVRLWEKRIHQSEE